MYFVILYSVIILSFYNNVVCYFPYTFLKFISIILLKIFKVVIRNVGSITNIMALNIRRFYYDFYY